MDLLQLKYFQVVARLENVTRAAEELHIAQPSLSKTISRLEESIGVPLFERQGRRIRLNQFGKIFLRRVNRSFNELEEGKREVVDLAGLELGSIAVGATTSRLLPNLFTEYLTYHPNVKFRLLEVRGVEIQERLINGEIDLCISTLPINNPIDQSRIHCEHLLIEEIALAVQPHHRLAAQNSILLSEVANEPFISLTTESGLQELTNNFCKQAGFTPNIAFESTNPEVICSLVISGLGIAFLPKYWWGRNSMDLPVQLHIENPTCQQTIWLSWVKERYLSLATRNFSKFIIEYFSRTNKNML